MIVCSIGYLETTVNGEEYLQHKQMLPRNDKPLCYSIWITDERLFLGVSSPRNISLHWQRFPVDDGQTAY